MAGQTKGAARTTGATTKATTKAVGTSAGAAARGRRPFKRPNQVGPFEATGRALRRGWLWVRLFALGFVLGAVWAYLFTPRKGPAFEALTEASRRSKSA
jgi:hypothetical protein